MYRNCSVLRSRVVAHEDEAPASVLRHGHDRLYADRLVRELVIAPARALVRAVHDVVGWAFVVCHDEDGARVAELPQMRVLVNLLPGEASVATEECVAILVALQGFSDVANGHKKPRD